MRSNLCTPLISLPASTVRNKVTKTVSERQLLRNNSSASQSTQLGKAQLHIPPGLSRSLHPSSVYHIHNHFVYGRVAEQPRTRRLRLSSHGDRVSNHSAYSVPWSRAHSERGIKSVLDSPLTAGTAVAVASDNCITTITCLLYTSPSPRDWSASRMPSSA